MVRDLIDRAEALKILRGILADGGKSRGLRPASIEMIFAIKSMQSAEPERKEGRWTVTPIYIKCSECNESFMLIPQNYCPNCGAKMERDILYL